MPLHRRLNVTPLFSIKTSIVLRRPARRLCPAPTDSSCTASRTQRPTPPTGGLLRSREGVMGCYQRDHSMDDCSLIENNEGHPEHMVTVSPFPLSLKVHSNFVFANQRSVC